MAQGRAPDATGGARDSATAVYRARFDECGPDGNLRPSAYLRWAQDVAWIHSERLGFGRDWYREQRLGWLVRAIDLSVGRPVPTRTELAVTTRVVGWRHVMARRRTDFVDPSGDLIAWLLTDWVLTDGSGSPTRVPAEFPARFTAPAGSFTPTRVPLGSPPPDAAIARFSVRSHELDPMGHVNHAVYLDYLTDVLATAGEAGFGAGRAIEARYTIEYLLAASPFDHLVETVWAEGAATVCALSRETDEGGAARRAPSRAGRGTGTSGLEPLARARIGSPAVSPSP